MISEFLSHFHDLLNVYLFPFVIALQIAIVLFLLISRRDEPPITQLGHARMPETDSRFAPTQPPGDLATTTRQTAPAMARQGLGADTAQGPVSTLEAASLRAQPGVAARSPFDGAPPLAPPATGRATPAVAVCTNLLLVDDSAVARAKLRKLFETAGYPVDLAKDGLEALELLGKKRYALMITDLEMPQMDGVELIAAVHGSLDTEDLPILAITGHDDLQAKVHECEGLFGIFKKPWNDRELLRRVDTLVRLQSAARAQA